FPPRLSIFPLELPSQEVYTPSHLNFGEEEVRMHVRFVIVLSLLVLPAFAQQPNGMQQIQHRYDVHDANLRPQPIAGFDMETIRHKAIAQDVADLSALSSSLQQDLQQLQHGMLAKDLSDKLKKVEKLSKRLRQEMAQEAASIASAAR
ncbi:MAG TPA: hypothetical protein VMX38_17785, partial [Verrucomicrobiae bacterium]|nr:hypothetical protein [Verrucomicrobiae bacterium]